MVKGLLGRKVGMTQVYDESGEAIPVTVIEAGPCHVLQLRTQERDGYEAVQLGFQDKKRPQGDRRQVSPESVSPQRAWSCHGEAEQQAGQAARCRRCRVASQAGVRAASSLFASFAARWTGWRSASEVTVGQLAEVTAVDVTGVSKGRGFAGVMKRHNFSGQRASHGVKKVHRHAGGTGMSAWPSRVVQGAPHGRPVWQCPRDGPQSEGVSCG